MHIRLHITSFITYIAYKPIDWINTIQAEVKSYKALKSERNEFEEKNKRLEEKVFSQERLINDLNEIKILYDSLSYMDETGISVKVLGGIHVFPNASLYCIGATGDPFEKNQVVMSEHGLIGKIFDVSNRLIKVLLLTDHFSRIPVRFQKNGKQALLVGQGTAELLLTPIDHLDDLSEEESCIKKDDLLVTSGLDDIYPPDLPVAKVSYVDKNEIYALPIGNLKTLKFVQILPLKKKN